MRRAHASGAATFPSVTLFPAALLPYGTGEQTAQRGDLPWLWTPKPVTS